MFPVLNCWAVILFIFQDSCSLPLIIETTRLNKCKRRWPNGNRVRLNGSNAPPMFWLGVFWMWIHFLFYVLTHQVQPFLSVFALTEKKMLGIAESLRCGTALIRVFYLLSTVVTCISHSSGFCMFSFVFCGDVLVCSRLSSPLVSELQIFG